MEYVIFKITVIWTGRSFVWVKHFVNLTTKLMGSSLQKPRAPDDKDKKAGTFDPNYQTMAGMGGEVFGDDKKKDEEKNEVSCYLFIYHVVVLL